MRSRITRIQPIIEAIDLQSLGAELRIYGEINDPIYRHFNPSIALHEGKLKISIRACNFNVQRHGKWSFRGNFYSLTDVLLGDLDPETLQVSNLQKLELSKDSPKTILTAGLEDVRLFSRKDGLHAVGFESDRITRSLHNASAKMAEYVIKGNELKYIRTLDKPVADIVEKNWSPTDTPSKLFDFTYSDTQVWKEGIVRGELSKTNIHGGTQLLKQKDGYLSLVHEKAMDRTLKRPGVYDKYKYIHYLAKHDNNGIITQKSKGFTFGTHENIEFAAGMVEHEGDLIITAGVRDCKYLICRISKNKLLNLI